MHKILICIFLARMLFAWSSPQNLGIPGADDMNPQTCRMIVEGNSCVTWQSNINGNWDIFSRFSHQATWDETIRVTTHVAADINPSVANNILADIYWCVWQNDSAGNWDIYAAYYDTLSGWSTPYQITADLADDEYPSVYVDDDTVWVVWQKTVAESVNIYASFYDGNTWSSQSAITVDSVGITNIRPKINAHDYHPFVVWERNEDIYYAEYINDEWQNPTAITSDVYSDVNPEIETEYGYAVCIVWQSDRDGNYEIYATERDNFSIHHRLTFNDSIDMMPSPLSYIEVGGYRQPYSTAFCTNRNGNYDIYFYFDDWIPSLGPVDTCSAEDILPTTTQDFYLYLWVIWQTDRNTDLDIYGSYLDMGHVIEEANTDVLYPIEKLTITPNPFQKEARITYYRTTCLLNADDYMELKVYNTIGEIVRQFDYMKDTESSCHQVYWDGKDKRGQILPEGVYFIRLKTESTTYTEKAILVR